MAYEAMNNAGAMKARLVVVLNDNEMSDRPAGRRDERLSDPAAQQQFSYLNLRDLASRMAKRFPSGMAKTAKRAEEYARGILTGGTLFEEIGLLLSGPDRRP